MGSVRDRCELPPEIAARFQTASPSELRALASGVEVPILRCGVCGVELGPYAREHVCPGGKHDSGPAPMSAKTSTDQPVESSAPVARAPNDAACGAWVVAGAGPDDGRAWSGAPQPYRPCGPFGDTSGQPERSAT